MSTSWAKFRHIQHLPREMVSARLAKTGGPWYNWKRKEKDILCRPPLFQRPERRAVSKQAERKYEMNIHKSAEDYLEMILMLREEKGYARSIDIAAALGVTKPSVSFAMKKLRENGYIQMDESNYITLTESGMKIARRIYDRHKAVTAILIQIGVDEKTAREDACKIEHDLSDVTFRAILRHTGLS